MTEYLRPAATPTWHFWVQKSLIHAATTDPHTGSTGHVEADFDVRTCKPGATSLTAVSASDYVITEIGAGWYELVVSTTTDFVGSTTEKPGLVIIDYGPAVAPDGYGVKTDIFTIQFKTADIPADVRAWEGDDGATAAVQNGLATASALATVATYIDTEVASILAAVDTEVAAILAAVDTEVATLVTNVATILAAVDTEVASILAAVDTEIGTIITNLGTANTNISSILTAVDTEVATLVTNVATILAAVDTEVAAILAAVDTEIATLVSGVANIQTRIPAALTAGGMLKVSLEEVRATAVPVPTVEGIPKVEATVTLGTDSITAAAVSAGAVTKIFTGLLNYELRTGRTVRGHLRRMDALFFGSVVGMLGSLVTAFRPDGITTEFTAVQDLPAGTRAAANVTASEVP